MVVVVLFATPESGHQQVPRVGILVPRYITAPPKPWASSDRFCPMSLAGHMFGNCSFVTGVGKCHHALAAGLTLIKLPRPFPEHSFSYLKWQLQCLCESFGAGTRSQHIPGKLMPGMLHGATYCWPPVHPRADQSSLWRVYDFKIIYWFLIVQVKHTWIQYLNTTGKNSFTLWVPGPSLEVTFQTFDRVSQACM